MSLNKSDIATRAALASWLAAAAQCSIYPIICSPGLYLRTLPYGAPVGNSLSELQAAFALVQAGNPYDKPITGALTGNGTMTLSIPNVVNEKLVQYCAVVVDVVFSNNDAPSPFKLSLSGQFSDGSAYSVTPFEAAFNSGAPFANQILILLAEETQQGPRLRPGRLASTGFAQQLNNGGSPVSAADLEVTVSDANAAMQFNVSVINAGHQYYNNLQRMLAFAPVAALSASGKYGNKAFADWGVTEISGRMPEVIADYERLLK